MAANSVMAAIGTRPDLWGETVLAALRQVKGEIARNARYRARAACIAGIRDTRFESATVAVFVGQVGFFRAVWERAAARAKRRKV